MALASPAYVSRDFAPDSPWHSAMNEGFNDNCDNDMTFECN